MQLGRYQIVYGLNIPFGVENFLRIQIMAKDDSCNHRIKKIQIYKKRAIFESLIS